MIVRPRVQRGQPLPVMVRISGRTGTASVNYDAGFGTVSIDGQPRRDMTLGGFGGAVGPNGSSGSRTYFDSNRIGEPLALGSRTARVVVPVQFRGQFDSHTIKRDIELTCAFEVVGESTVTAIRDDALRDALVAATKVQLNWWPPNGGEIPLGVSLDFKDLPATLSHDVWLRADGNETLFTTVAMPKGARMTFGGPGPTPAGDVVDVIFRPNPSVAEKSHALFEYWDGEFVIEGVKVPPKPAPDAAE